MLNRNIDFIAVLVITLVMLGLHSVRASRWQEARDWFHMDSIGVDSIQVIPAVQIDRCPLTSDLLSRLTCILPH